MHCIMQNLKKNAQVFIYYLADLNIRHLNTLKIGEIASVIHLKKKMQ